MPLQAGQMAGDYEVLGVLGKGGMGRVYRVRNVISDRIEAMKVLLEDIDSEPGVSERFMAEIRTLARMDHPGIAKFYTAFRVQSQLVMVMEYVDGIDLAEKARGTELPAAQVIGYIKQVLAALSYAHKLGVVHRDLKPSNMMVTRQDEVKLMDFGIAKSSTETKLTRTGMAVGSLPYMSPEQVRGSAIDARSDLYSLGIVLYELTAGRCPFEGDSAFEIMNAQLNTPPPPPIERNRHLPSRLNEIILTALQKNPADRFQNCVAFLGALESVSSVKSTQLENVSAPAVSSPLVLPVESSKRPAVEAPQVAGRRGRLPVLAMAGICVVAAVLVSAHFWKSRAPQSTAPEASVHRAPASTSLPAVSSVRPEPPRESQTDNGSISPDSIFPKPATAAPKPKKAALLQPQPQDPLPRHGGDHFAAPGVSFGGDRDVISRGQPVVLRWSATDATRVQILPGFPALAPSGSVTVSPTTNTRYTLLAEGPGGTASRQFTVRIEGLSQPGSGALSVLSFGADQQAVLLGTSTSLRWNVQGAARVMIVPGVGVVPPSGSISVKPLRTTRYVLVASAADGSSVARQLTVSVSSQQ